MTNPGKILHLIKDEKITDQIIGNFNLVDEGHVFLVLEEKDFRLTQSRGENVIFFDYRKEDINKTIDKYSIGAIIVHALFPPQVETLLKIKKKLSVGWFVWGFDLYGLPKIQPKTYAPKTNRFLLNSKKDLRVAWWIRKRPFFRKFYYGKIVKRRDKISELETAIAKTDYFISYIREDFKLFSKHYPNRLEYLHCGFSTIDQYLAGDKLIKLNEDAKNILVGNSSSPENNHLDVFPVLEKVGLPGAKIIVPLNYGYLEAHKTKVLEAGKSALGEKFHPLLDFMERKDYVSLLQSCSVAVFYHYRQQAMGNVLALLYMGARVYLSSKNPLFSYFKRLKIRVFDFDEEFKIHLNQKLDKKTQFQNREIIESEFSEEKIIGEMTKVSNKMRNPIERR